MKLVPHQYTPRVPLLWLSLLVAMVSAGSLAAEEGASGFQEIAAEAAAARDVNDAPRAIALYTQALALDPKWQDGWWSLGLLRYQSEAYAPATDAFSHLLALNPGAVPAIALRGLCEFETGDYPQSLTDLQKAIASGAADNAEHEQLLRYHLAMALTRLGDFENALRAYAPFAEHRISNPELLVAIGLAGLRMPLLPKDATADQQPLLSAVGGAAFEFMGGDQSASREAFNEVFQRFPTARGAHFLYGNLLLAFGPDAAAPEFKKELELAPDNENARVMLAWSLLLQNRATEALPYARRIAEQSPDKAASRLILGKALVDTGDPAGGIVQLERAVKLQPDNLEIHIALVNAYSKSGRDGDARRERALCLQMSESGAVRIAHP